MPDTRILHSDDLIAHHVDNIATDLEAGTADPGRVLLAVTQLRNLAADIRKPMPRPRHADEDFANAAEPISVPNGLAIGEVPR